MDTQIIPLTVLEKDFCKIYVSAKDPRREDAIFSVVLARSYTRAKALTQHKVLGYDFVVTVPKRRSGELLSALIKAGVTRACLSTGGPRIP